MYVLNIHVCVNRNYVLFGIYNGCQKFPINIYNFKIIFVNMFFSLYYIS